MIKYVTLLRGVNVGGSGILPMKDLVSEVEALGLRNVRTYIQSGNLVFTSRRTSSHKLATDIAGAIEQNHGFRPGVLVMSTEKLASAAAANPFPEAESEPKTLHLFFLAALPANPDIARIDELTKPTERYRLIGDVFYLHAPDGIGTSRLAGRVEKLLGVSATGRNWRTVQKLLDMARDD